MATWQSLVTMDTGTKAGVTACINKVHEAMLSVGCTQSEDTGQLDTEDYPSIGHGVVYGFRVYLWEDVFIKIVFVGQNEGTRFAVDARVSIAFSTDGAGGLIYPSAGGGARAGYSIHGSITPVATSGAQCYACNTGDFLFVTVGIGYYVFPNVSAGTALFFAITRLGDGSVVLYHTHNNSVRPSSTTELAHSVLKKTLPYVAGPNFFTLHSLALQSVDGSAVAFPATVCGPDFVFCDTNVCSVRRAAVTENTTVSLSVDDVNDRTYLVLKTPPSGTPTAHSLDVVADTKARYDLSICVRWE